MLHLDNPSDSMLDHMEIHDAVRWADSNPSHEAAKHMQVLINQLREMDAILSDMPDEDAIQSRIDDAVVRAVEAADEESERRMDDLREEVCEERGRAEELEARLEAAGERIMDLEHKLREAQAARLRGAAAAGTGFVISSGSHSNGLTFGARADGIMTFRPGGVIDIGSLRNGGGGSA